ncbi:MFS transporter [Streptomyces roseolilacinus]|uniref:MFS transporter n=1 Tax=Streptomyces roseolilacinus TaxID=66904 RepID=UPI0037FFD96D
MTATAAEGRPQRLRDNRDFRLWWGGTLLSSVGDEATRVALPLLVLLVTGSPLHAGLVGSVQAIPPLVLGLPLGVLVDRVSRRSVMTTAAFVSTVSIATVPVAFLMDALTLPQLYLVALCNSATATAYRIANTAALPHITGPHRLGEAAGQNETIWGVSALLAPPLAGLLFETVSPAAPFLVDALSFTVLAVALLAIRSPLGPDADSAPLRWRRELTEGARVILRLPVVRCLTVLATIGDFVFAGIGLLLIVLARESGASGLEVGAVFTAAGVGSLAGSALARRVELTLGLRAAVIGKHWLTAAFFPALLLDVPSWGIATVWGLIAFQVAVLNVMQMKYLMAQVPGDHLGRAQGLMTLLSQGSVPLGYALTGLLLDLFGARGTVLFLDAVLLALAGYATVARGLRATAENVHFDGQPLGGPGGKP